MSSVIYLLVITQAVSVTAAQGQGSSCHYKNGCIPPPDVCSVTPPACQADWFGTFCQMHNIARGKPASQSTTHTDSTGPYDAGKAVDGDVSTNWTYGSCSHTDEQDGGPASWHVFLRGTFIINRITVYLRDDAIDHNKAMEVLVNNRTCRKLPVTDIISSSNHLISNPLTLSCTQPIEGDTVTIVMTGPNLALCEVQVFGEKKESCHCSNGCSNFPNAPCSTQSSGQVCKPPWFGHFCEMENIAYQKTARQSSNYSEYSRPFCAAYAVDGNNDTDFSQRSCSHTNNAPASWQVLLDDHQMFNISRIRIYLRSDMLARNDGMQVLVNGDLCVPVSGTTDWLHGSVTNPFDVTCTNVMKGNNVTITISGQILTLCEVQVFVCSDGWFGGNCEKQCQCLNPSEVCDKETGYCRSGCAAGKQGPGCQNPVCNDRFFGSNCIQQCQCLDPSEVCDKETGYCRSGCAAGKQGPGCQQDCGQGQYGINCSSTCGQCSGWSDCKKDDGNCTQECQNGFLLPLCKDCEEGRYGVNCSQRCGSCKDDSPCNTTTGVCTQGCADNFQTHFCKLCSDRWFGTNCSEPCWCQNETEVCNKTTGYCTSGCRAGTTGVGCQNDCGQGQYGINCSSTCGQCSGWSDCKKDDGNCTQGCQNGFLLPLCKDCVEGRYGVNCSQRCGSCKDGSPCNTTTGVCTQGCADNFAQPDCKYCVKGRHGVNCEHQCGTCKDGSPCNTTSGVCVLGCTDNFEEPYCKSCVQGKYSVNCSATCGHCKDGPGCDRSTGHCERGCLPGYAPPLCVKECGDYTYGVNCSGVCSCLNQCEVCDKVTGECGTGYQTTATTAPDHYHYNVYNDVRFIVVCCLMALALVYSAVVTTYIVRLRRQQALTKAELERQYMSLETRGESSVYDVIAGTHTYSNDIQPGGSDYENTNTHVKKHEENSL